MEKIKSNEIVQIILNFRWKTLLLFVYIIMHIFTFYITGFEKEILSGQSGVKRTIYTILYNDRDIAWNCMAYSVSCIVSTL